MTDTKLASLEDPRYFKHSRWTPIKNATGEDYEYWSNVPDRIHERFRLVKEKALMQVLEEAPNATEYRNAWYESAAKVSTTIGSNRKGERFEVNLIGIPFLLRPPVQFETVAPYALPLMSDNLNEMLKELGLLQGGYVTKWNSMLVPFDHFKEGGLSVYADAARHICTGGRIVPASAHAHQTGGTPEMWMALGIVLGRGSAEFGVDWRDDEERKERVQFILNEMVEEGGALALKVPARMGLPELFPFVEHTASRSYAYARMRDVFVQPTTADPIEPNVTVMDSTEPVTLFIQGGDGAMDWELSPVDDWAELQSLWASAGKTDTANPLDALDERLASV